MKSKAQIHDLKPKKDAKGGALASGSVGGKQYSGPNRHLLTHGLQLPTWSQIELLLKVPYSG